MFNNYIAQIKAAQNTDVEIVLKPQKLTHPVPQNIKGYMFRDEYYSQNKISIARFRFIVKFLFKLKVTYYSLKIKWIEFYYRHK